MTNLYETQVINRKATILAAEIRRAMVRAECHATTYQAAYRGLLEMVSEGLHTSADPTDHAFFSVGVGAYFDACKRLAAYPNCGIGDLDRLEFDEYAAYLTARDGFRVVVVGEVG